MKFTCKHYKSPIKRTAGWKQI